MQRRTFGIVLFVAYCAILIDVMVFKNIPTIHIGHMVFRFGGGAPGPANLIPFQTIIPYLQGAKGGLIDAVELLGNIIPLIPLGMLAVCVFRDMGWISALALSVATGVVLETLQVLFQVGVFDIDDVILNGLGVMIGYGICAVLLRWVRRSE